MYYAMNFVGNVSSDVHIFATKSERDSWVDARYETRAPLSAKHARRSVKFYGRAYTHGDAYVPTSWRSGYWKLVQTSSPGVSEVYDVVKRYCH